MNIIIIGPPGSGKGTVCKRLVEEFDYKLICAGDLLRKEKASGSKIGSQIASLIDKGNLAPDEMVTKIIYNEIKSPIKLGQSFLLDGFPRTLEQAKSLDLMINIPVVIWLNVSDDTSIKRNLKRGLTSGRPDDGNIEIIKSRLEIYKKESLSLRKYYDSIIVDIDGEGTQDEVYKSIIDIFFETHKELKDINDILED